MSRNNQCCFCQKVLKAMHILMSLLVSLSDFLRIQYLSNSCKTWQNEGIGSITWNMQNGKNEDKKEGKTRNCQWPCTIYLIFITNTNNISVEKFVLWRYFRFLNVTDMEKSEVSPHMEKFLNSPHHRCGQIWNFSTSCMCVMWRMSPHKCKIYFVLLYNRFCHNLRCFVAKYVLLWFAHFCVEKI